MRKKSIKREKFHNNLILVILCAMLIGLVLSSISSNQIQSEGNLTTATVVATDMRNVSSNDRTRWAHYTTFEYVAQGELVRVTRTRDSESSRAPHRVGEQREIYYSSQNIERFVFADQGSPFGVMFWILTIGLTGGICFFVYRGKTLKRQAKEELTIVITDN